MAKLKPSLQDQFPRTDKKIMRVIEALLQLNPAHRPTAKELLKWKVFDRMRIKEYEHSTPIKILIEVDQSNPANYE